MGRYSSSTGGSDFVQAPAGSHVARCIRIVDLGTQEGKYEGKVTHKNQIIISWELCHEMMDVDGVKKPFIVSKFLTNSLGEKANLRKILINWRGRDFTEDELKKFDLQSILGAPCIVSVVHNDKGKAVIEGVIKLTKGTEAPAAQNNTFALWIDEFDRKKFDGLSDGIKAIIEKSPEYLEAVNPPAHDDSMPPRGGDFTPDGSFDDFENSIPF